MGFPLRDDFQAGWDSVRVPAEFLNTLARFLNTFRVRFWKNSYAWVDRTASGQDSTIWLPSAYVTTETVDTYAFRGFQTADQAGTLTMTIEPGAAVLAGVPVAAIANLPSTQLMTANGTRYNYVSVELSSATASYVGDSAVLPDGDDDTEVVCLHQVTTGASAITALRNRQCGDIHIERSSE